MFQQSSVCDFDVVWVKSVTAEIADDSAESDQSCIKYSANKYQYQYVTFKYQYQYKYCA